MTQVLATKALNRATLDRQMLLRRTDMSATDAVTHLVALQSQIPHNHYMALWTRLESFDAEDFSRRFEAREFVRVGLLRGTIHTVTARDCLALRPVLQVLLDRQLKSTFGKGLVGVDLAVAAARARALIEARPMTFAEIGQALHAEWPDNDRQALGQVARAALVAVQVPPRGLWQHGGLPRHTTAEHWLGAALGTDTSADELVLRYLAAFGPASVNDVQAWCGLTKLREVVERHRKDLVTFTDDRGVELFDLPDAPRPGEDVPAPPRFLPEYDNVFLGHKDRRRIVLDRIWSEIWWGNTQWPVFTVDGYIAGRWAVDTDAKRNQAALTLTPLTKIDRKQRADVETEGARLLAFQASGADHDIRWDDSRLR
jgi:hypothetical protein